MVQTLRHVLGLSTVQKSSRMSAGFDCGETLKGNHQDLLPHKIPKDEGWDYPWSKLLRMMAAPADFALSSRTLGALRAPLPPPALPWHRGCFPPSSPSIPWKRAVCIHAPGKLHNFPQGCMYRIIFCVHPAQPGLAPQLRLRFVPCVRTELCDLQEVTNLARIRWGPCTRAQALPHLLWVTQSGSESWHGETPAAWRGRGQLLLLSKDLSA